VGDGPEVEAGVSTVVAWAWGSPEGEEVVGKVPVVGLGGMGAGKVGEVVLVAEVVPCLDVQPARAAPAATVAVSLINVRREIGGRRFIWVLLAEYRKRIPVMGLLEVYYKRNQALCP